MAAMGGRPARCTRSIRLRVAAFNRARGLVWWLLMGKKIDRAVGGEIGSNSKSGK
ncbi:MAG: hypothetical protein RLZZ329_395 [Pseudomonadota bacterium]